MAHTPIQFFFLGGGGYGFETGFLCSFGACPGTRSVGQVGLKLTEMHLLLPPEFNPGIKDVCHHYPAPYKILKLVFCLFFFFRLFYLRA